jgi:hypothetical protein
VQNKNYYNYLVGAHCPPRTVDPWNPTKFALVSVTDMLRSFDLDKKKVNQKYNLLVASSWIQKKRQQRVNHMTSVNLQLYLLLLTRTANSHCRCRRWALSYVLHWRRALGNNAADERRSCCWAVAAQPSVRGRTVRLAYYGILPSRLSLLVIGERTPLHFFSARGRWQQDVRNYELDKTVKVLKCSWSS